MSSRLIYTVKYRFTFLLLELHAPKAALTNLSQFSRLSPTQIKWLHHYIKAAVYAFFMEKRAITSGKRGESRDKKLFVFLYSKLAVSGSFIPVDPWSNRK